MGLLSLGSRIVVMKKSDVNKVVNAIDEYKVTHFPVVPPILTALTIKVKDGLAEQSLKSLKQVCSGDVVYFDEDGYLNLQDRLKDVIKYKGFQIALADLESVWWMKKVGRYRLVAFVVRKHGSRISKENVMDFVAAQVAPYKKDFPKKRN
ncbi:hypothetical protein PS2_008762 [Malus domestica]